MRQTFPTEDPWDKRCPACSIKWAIDRHKNHKDRHIHRAYDTRQFIGIDGEGGEADECGRQNYLLLSAYDAFGKGKTLFKNNNRLTTRDCLEFILSLPPAADATLMGYYFDYDVTQILRDLADDDAGKMRNGRPPDRLQRLFRSRETFDPNGKRISPYTHWRDYGIDYIPRQYFAVTRLERSPTGERRPVPGSYRVINEGGTFFQKAFVTALTEWQIGDADILAMIAKQKGERPEFDRVTPDIMQYNKEECIRLAELMMQFRRSCKDAEKKVNQQRRDLNLAIVPKKWRGAGHVAAHMHESTGTPKQKHLAKVNPLPPTVQEMATAAYYGGRFEISSTGYIAGPVYEYDINSAYPSAMPKLPCLLHTKWNQVARPTQGSLYVAALTFSHPSDNRWCGFPVRHKGHLHWPLRGSGWYWSPEIEAAALLGARVKFHEIWEAVIPCGCAPFDWVPLVYDIRKAIGKGTKGYPLKLGLNALYGKLAQQKGAQTYYNAIHAGLITAMTRANLIRAIAQDPRAVVMAATDGIYSTRQLELDLGDALGTWELKEHPDMFIVQPGFYWFPGEDQAGAALKTRGIPKSVVQKYAPEFEQTWRQFVLNEQRSSPGSLLDSAPFVLIPHSIFIGLRLALARGDLTLAGRWQQPCSKAECNHEDCGSKEISFDWSNKRRDGLLVGARVYHYPIEGSAQIWSERYDPQQLSLLRQYSLETEAMPDSVRILDR